MNFISILTKNIRSHPVYLLLVAILIGLVIRVILAHIAFHDDIIVLTEWGKVINERGYNGYYAWGIWVRDWPAHPPLIIIIYGLSYKLHSVITWVLSNVGYFIATHRLAPTYFLWLYDYNTWFGMENFEGNGGFLKGVAVSVKYFSIIGDIILAAIFYFLAKKEKLPALKIAILYLFLPFSWYLSAVWGQTDQISFTFLFLSIICIIKKPILAPFLFLTAINFKLTALIFTPLFIWIFIKNKPDLRTILTGIILGIIPHFFVLWLYNNQIETLWRFISYDLPLRFFFTRTPYTVVSAFNFWEIFHGRSTVLESTRYLFLSSKIWGLLLFFFINVLAFKAVKKRSFSSLLAAFFVTGMGGWLFLTNMYERYVFAGLLCGFFYSFYRKSLFKYFLILTFIFWVNLYNGWWYPAQLNFLRGLLTFNNNLIVRLLSLTNIIIYGLITYKILTLREAKEPD